MHSLPLFVRLSGEPVVLIGAGAAADAKRRLIEQAGGIPVDEADERAGGARIAFVALEDGAEAAGVAARLKARGLLVNVADRPEHCDFTTPAIVDRDPVLVAVSTGGASAGLAKALRQRIERLLPPGLGALATALARVRLVLHVRWPDARARRHALDEALREGGALDPLRAHAPGAVRDWLEADGAAPRDRIETILLGSADPDDLTLRAARLLGEADRIVHDGRVPPAILARARADAARVVAAAGEPVPPAPGLTLILRITAM